jgi:radical SAM superfamily enzyme YgiQ (UPF0313 family)
MTQGRTDFIAKYPELIARLARNGLVGVLSGYETNDADALEGLRKRNTLENNIAAARILQENGVISTGIFMVRPDFEEKDFKDLYSYIEEIGVALPLVTILTPLPGTQQFREKRDQLLTEDFRFYDLLHPILETRLSREDFYKNFVAWKYTYRTNRNKFFNLAMLKKRWHLFYTMLPAIPGTIYRGYRFQKIQFDYRSYLRDEAGIIPEKLEARP